MATENRSDSSVERFPARRHLSHSLPRYDDVDVEDRGAPNRSAESERPVMDVRNLVAHFPWNEVPDPAVGSGSMTDVDGRPMSDAEVDQWWSDRLRARR